MTEPTAPDTYLVRRRGLSATPEDIDTATRRSQAAAHYSETASDGLDELRTDLLAGLGLTERRLSLAGVRTGFLEGGEGPPIVLLHGPGESAAAWLPVLPELTRTHHVVAVDLPGHGPSGLPDSALDLARMNVWTHQLVAATCASPPVLVGRVVGGAVGARFAAAAPGRLAHLVLVDTMGLTSFAPDPRLWSAVERHLAAPSLQTYDSLMEVCSADLDHARTLLGDRWPAFAEYATALMRQPRAQAAMGGLLGLYGAAIAPAELARIDVPITLVWGREDLATRLSIAEDAGRRHGWPLHVIDGAGDDPPLDQPAAFLDALRSVLDPVGAS